MPDLHTIAVVALAGLLLSVTPGPSMLYVLSRSVGQSRSAGLASALGLALGGVVLAMATALGLAAVFATFDWMAPTLRIVGSVYLVWLGVGMIREALDDTSAALRAQAVRRRSFLSIVWQGALVELLNPKTVLFFALFLPPFVETGTEASVRSQLLVLGVLVPLTAVPSDLLVAWTGGTMTRIVNDRQCVRRTLAWVGGIALIVIAANLHLGFL